MGHGGNDVLIWVMVHSGKWMWLVGAMVVFFFYSLLWFVAGGGNGGFFLVMAWVVGFWWL